MERRFKSIQHPNEFGYTYDTDAWRGADISPHFQMWQTLGDGFVQHSSAFPITTEHLTDYLASIAAAMVAEAASGEDNPIAERLVYDINRRPQDKDIEFAASVIYKADPVAEYREKKRRYYSVAEMKITSSPAKQYDKRYHEVEQWCNGEPTAVYRMLIPESTTTLEKYSYAKAIGDWFNAQPDKSMPSPAAFLKWRDFADWDKCHNLDYAFDAASAMVKSYAMRKNAERSLEYLRRTLAPKAEENTEEVA